MQQSINIAECMEDNSAACEDVQDIPLPDAECIPDNALSDDEFAALNMYSMPSEDECSTEIVIEPFPVDPDGAGPALPEPPCPPEQPQGEESLPAVQNLPRKSSHKSSTGKSRKRSRAKGASAPEVTEEMFNAWQQQIQECLDFVVDHDSGLTVADCVGYSRDGERGFCLMVARLFRQKYAVKNVNGSYEFYILRKNGLYEFDEKNELEAQDTTVALLLDQVRQKLSEAARIANKAYNETEDEGIGNLKGKLVDALGYIRGAISKANNSTFFRKVIKRAAVGATGWIVPENDWDRDAGTLTTPAGIVDLTTGELRTCTWEDRRTKKTNVELPPEDFPQPELFLATLRQIFAYMGKPEEPHPGPDGKVDPDDQAAYDIKYGRWESGQVLDEFLEFFQESLGSTLFGLNRDQKFYIWIGERGRNGKGLIMHALEGVLGDYFGNTRSETFMKSRGRNDSKSPTPELVVLPGKRIVVCQECDPGDTLHGALLKRMTGGDKMSVRALYGKEKIIDVTWVPFLVTNYYPRFDTDDDALAARSVCIQFQNTFRGKEDLDLENKLKAEYPAILRWLVDGAVRYHRRGRLVIPECVEAANRKYYADRDIIGEFVGQYCRVGAGLNCDLTDLYRAFSQYVYENGMKDWMRKTFKEHIKLKFPVHKVSTDRVEGIALLDDAAIGGDDNGNSLIARWKMRKQKM